MHRSIQDKHATCENTTTTETTDNHNKTFHSHNTHLTALCPGLPGSAGTRKATPIWILLKQQTVSGSGISWAIRKSAPRSRQITMPAPDHSIFLPAGCPSCHPTNSVKALKENSTATTTSKQTALDRGLRSDRLHFSPYQP